MKIPKMCKKTASFDDRRAGWYVRNSVRVEDITPEWGLPGGGVCRDELGDDVIKCLKQAIIYSRHRVLAAESHIRKLEIALEEATNDSITTSKGEGV